jgi:hypothetical protein
MSRLFLSRNIEDGNGAAGPPTPRRRRPRPRRPDGSRPAAQTVVTTAGALSSDFAHGRRLRQVRLPVMRPMYRVWRELRRWWHQDLEDA